MGGQWILKVFNVGGEKLIKKTSTALGPRKISWHSFLSPAERLAQWPLQRNLRKPTRGKIILTEINPT